MSVQKYPTIGKGLVVPFALITTCFALWGAANNMTDLLVTVFKQVKEMSSLQASVIQTAFYFAYFLAPIPAAFFLKKFGYKASAVGGLVLYAVGAFLCYPASQVDSFSFFLVAFFTFAFGCAILETSVAPFILAMGPKETSTQRINLAQSFNPVGSVGGIMLGKFVILQHLTSPERMASLEGAEKAAAQAQDLGLVVNAYAVVGLIALVVAIAIFMRKFPDIKGEESHSTVSESLSRLIKNKNYIFSVIAQFFYVAAQIGIWTFIIPFALASGSDFKATLCDFKLFGGDVNITLGSSDANEAWGYYFLSIICILIGRFIYTALMKKFDPARLLSVGMGLAIFFTACAIFGSGNFAVFSVVMISLVMSLGFPTIYGLGLTGLEGDDRKVGGSGIIMAIVGGAILVPLQGLMNDGRLPDGDFFVDAFIRTIFTPVKGIFDSIGFSYSSANSYLMPLTCFIIILVYSFIAHNKEEEEGILHENED